MFLIPTWLILAIIIGLLSNGFNIFNRYFLKDGEDATAYGWYVEVLRVIVFGVFSIFSWKLIITPYSFLILLLLGLSEAMSIYFYMKMHAHSHLSISSILSRTRLIWVPLLGFLMIHETLKFSDYMGILIIFVGVSATIAPKKLFIDKGALYANLAAFFIALNIIFVKMALPYGSTAVLNMLFSLPAVILLPIFMKSAIKRVKAVVKKNFLLKTSAIGLNLFQTYLFFIALEIGDASKINAVYQGMLIISVLVGIIFLKERENIARKIIGSIITIIGVIIISMQ
jgi:transporter family protein